MAAKPEEDYVKRGDGTALSSELRDLEYFRVVLVVFGGASILTGGAFDVVQLC